MTTANWLTILVTLATSATTLIAIAVKWGGVLVRLAACETAVSGLTRAHEKRGERLGVVEKDVGTIQGILSEMPGPTAPQGRIRTRSRAIPIGAPTYVPPDPEGSARE